MKSRAGDAFVGRGWGGGFLFPHGFSFEGYFVGVVDESVEDGIGQRGVSDGFVPVVEGNLGGDEGGACLVSVFDYLEEVSAVLVRQDHRCPVIEDEELCFGECVHEFGIASVGFGHAEFLEQSAGAVVLNAESFAAGFVSKGAGEVGFPDSGGAGDEEIVVLANPLAGGQGEHDGFVESASSLVVDVFEGGVEPKFGFAQSCLKSPVVTFGVFAFDDESDSFVEGEALVVGAFELFAVGILHSAESEFLEFLERWVGEHDVGFLPG